MLSVVDKLNLNFVLNESEFTQKHQILIIMLLNDYL